MMSIPHLMIPLQITPESWFAANEQDSLDDLAQCIKVLMYTEIKDRIEVPAYGVKPMLFSTVDPVAVTEAINKWEPRARVDISTVIGVIDGSGSWDELITNVTELVRSRR